jgi:hypothetical protein
VAADLTAFQRKVATDELADLLVRLAGLDPDTTATRH